MTLTTWGPPGSRALHTFVPLKLVVTTLVNFEPVVDELCKLFEC